MTYALRSNEGYGWLLVKDNGDPHIYAETVGRATQTGDFRRALELGRRYNCEVHQRAGGGWQPTAKQPAWLGAPPQRS